LKKEKCTIIIIIIIIIINGPGVDETSNRNEYQESSWGNGRPAGKADNFTAICEPTVYKMWEPQRLTTLCVSTACYRDRFTFLNNNRIISVKFPLEMLDNNLTYVIHV
jgi:hypothetical protein